MKKPTLKRTRDQRMLAPLENVQPPRKEIETPLRSTTTDAQPVSDRPSGRPWRWPLAIVLGVVSTAIVQIVAMVVVVFIGPWLLAHLHWFFVILVAFFAARFTSALSAAAFMATAIHIVPRPESRVSYGLLCAFYAIGWACLMIWALSSTLPEMWPDMTSRDVKLLLFSLAAAVWGTQRGLTGRF